jgi:uncharacterized protein with ParB-like and HNH nuclease domain
MAQGTVSLFGLINNIQSFEVPNFQRNYSWTEDQIDSFHTDLKFARTRKSDHFLGSTILMKSNNSAPEDKSYQIIDGQQRLTTIFMYIALIRDYVQNLDNTSLEPSDPNGVTINVHSKATEMLFSDESTGESRFKSNELLRETFISHIIREPSSSRPSFRSRDKYWTLDLRKSYKRISDLIKEDIKNLDPEGQLRILWEMLQTLRDRLQILPIYTTTYPESFDIFMTLNSRGLALGPSDLVKSLFMKYMASNASNADAIVEINENVSKRWKEITDQIGDGDVDQFLRHYLVSTEEESVQSKRIYSIFDAKFNNSRNSPSTEADYLLRELDKKAQIYSQLLKPANIEDTVLRTSCATLHLISDSYRILMLILLDEESSFDVRQKRELVKTCEVLTMRWILTGGNAQELEDIFQNTCKKYRDSNANFDEVKTVMVSKIPSDQKCGAQFDLDVSRSALIRAVLFRINSIFGDQAGLVSLDTKKMHIEHIAPETSSDHWLNQLFPENPSESFAEYSIVVEQWGNKTLLEKPINESIGQKPFLEKCDGVEGSNFGGYRNSILQMTKDLTHYNSWSVALIKKRSRWIKECFLSIWSLDPDYDSVVPFPNWTDPNQD